MSIKHKFISNKLDSSDPSLVNASNWNDEHDLTQLTEEEKLLIGTSGYSGYSGFSGADIYVGTEEPSNPQDGDLWYNLNDYGGIGTSGYSGYSGVQGVSGYSGYSGALEYNPSFSGTLYSSNLQYGDSGAYAIRPALKHSFFGYGEPKAYRTLVIGSTGTSSADIGNISGAITPCINEDVSDMDTASFIGNGSEIIFRNGVRFYTPNAARTGFHLDYIRLQDGIVNVSLGQLRFPPTQNPSNDPNILDDYEEGTWFPALGRLTTNGVHTYTQQEGVYVKVGRIVTVAFSITITDTTLQGTGANLVTGFPFPFSNHSSAFCAHNSICEPNKVRGLYGIHNQTYAYLIGDGYNDWMNVDWKNGTCYISAGLTYPTTV